MNFSIPRILSNALALALAIGIAGLAACGGGGGAPAVTPPPAANPLMGGAVKSVVPGLAAASSPSAVTVSTIAGAASLNLDGTGGTARFNGPTNSVSDGTNLYVADSNNNSIRQIVIATGAVTTLAGSPTGASGSTDATGSAATFYYPSGITIDPTHTNLYVADMYNGKIRQVVILTGAVTTLAGYGNTCCTMYNGTGTAASFYYPTGITTDGTNLYVADMYDNTIRQITPATGTLAAMTSANATVSTLAGSGPYGYGSVDSTGTAASFGYPRGITTDGTSLYVGDTNNNKIRKITPATGLLSAMTSANAVVTTLAGTGNWGATDGAGLTAATFNAPSGITTDGTNLYVADTNNNEIRKVVIASGVVSTLAGNTADCNSQDGTGTVASFCSPQGITSVGANLYVADANNNEIRQIVASTGAVTTLAGAWWAADGTGAAANFSNPGSTTTDGTNLYVADSNNNTIRKIVIATGVTTTLAGGAGESSGFVDGIGAQARFYWPQGITTDGTNLYVTDQGNNAIRQVVIATGAVTTLAGSLAGNSGYVDGPGVVALFSNWCLGGITTDNTNLYVADECNQVIRKIVIATGVVSTLAGSIDRNSGYADGTGADVLFNYPWAITTDGTNLYVGDGNNNVIRQIVIASGAVTTLAGQVSNGGFTDGAGNAATFNWIEDITTDGTNLYVTDQGNQKIRQIVIATGVVSSVTGAANTSSGYGYVDGTADLATFENPSGITSDGQSLYVTDYSDSTIRKLH